MVSFWETKLWWKTACFIHHTTDYDKFQMQVIWKSKAKWQLGNFFSSHHRHRAKFLIHIKMFLEIDEKKKNLIEIWFKLMVHRKENIVSLKI